MLSEELKNKIDKEVQKFIDINNMPLGDYYLVNQVKDMVVDIIENSNIVELPCKVGDKVYVILSPIPLLAKGKIFEEVTTNIFYDVITNKSRLSVGDCNKLWFTDKAKAEERLKELNNES